MLERIKPEPFDVLIARNVRDVVEFMAGFDQRFVVLGAVELARIDNHGPALGVQGVGTFFIVTGGNLGLSNAGQGAKASQPAAQGTGRKPRHFQKASSALVHYLLPWGMMWQVQQ